MKYPNFREEKRLWRKGYKIVAGLDEAGRGPLAGPVVAATVCFKKNLKPNIYNSISNLKDSKKLTPKKREEIFQILKKNPGVEWGIGRVSEKVIDRINILEATKLAMKRAVKNFESRLNKKYSHGPIRIPERSPKGGARLGYSHADFLIIDGNFGINLDIKQKPIIKADEKVFSCAAASIIAKVSRDRMMLRYHKKYPCYCFDRHKGYPTKLHKKMLKKYRPCKIHRKSFRPVIRISKIKNQKCKNEKL